MRCFKTRNFIKSIIIASAVLLGSTTVYASQTTSPGTTASAELTSDRTWNFTVGKNRDLFSNMKNLMPGDTIENTVAITNNSSRNVSFYFRVRPGDISSIEADSEDAAAVEGLNYHAGLLDIISMEIWRGENLLYQGNASGSKTAGEAGGVIALGEVETGRVLNLRIVVKLPGKEMTNEYAAAFSKLDWQFIAEGSDGEIADDSGGDSGDSGNNGGGNTPGGDNGGGNATGGGSSTAQGGPGGNQPTLADNAAGAGTGDALAADAIAPVYQGGGILAENVPEEELFPEGMVVDNPDDIQIVIEDEPVPLAAFSDMVEPGIIMRWLDIFLVLAVFGLVGYYLLPAGRRRKEEKS